MGITIQQHNFTTSSSKEMSSDEVIPENTFVNQEIADDVDLKNQHFTVNLEREAGYFKSVGAYSLYAFMNVANNLKLSITGQTLTLNISVHYQHNINFKGLCRLDY